VYYDNCYNTVSWLTGDMDLDRHGRNQIALNGSAWVDSHWETGAQHLLSATRNLLGPNAIIVGNGNLYDETWANGQLNEGFNNMQFANQDITQQIGNSWSDNLTRYLNWSTTHYGQLYYILDQDPNARSSTQTNYQEMRYYLATTLLGDGYFYYGGPATNYTETWWYDEYSVNLATGQATGDASRKGYLGYALNTAQLLSNGVWWRDFDNGIVLVNPTNSVQHTPLKSAFRRIAGSQDSGANNGATITNLNLQSHDGIILLRLSQT
jgi:hypothetical protein